MEREVSELAWGQAHGPAEQFGDRPDNASREPAAEPGKMVRLMVHRMLSHANRAFENLRDHYGCANGLLESQQQRGNPKSAKEAMPAPGPMVHPAKEAHPGMVHLDHRIQGA